MIRYEEWIKRAKGSLDLAKTKIIYDINYEDLCYQAQQSAEKAFKGLLIYFEVEPEFTHSIEKLIEELIKFTEVPENIKAATDLTMYAVSTRYPGSYDAITKEEYEKAIKTAEDCLEWVNKTIKDIEEQKTKPHSSE